MPARATRLRLECLEDRATPAGNVLAVINPLHDPQQINEYAPNGTLVRTLPLPPRAEGGRDLIVGPNGDIHLYVATDILSPGGPYPTELDTYHAATGTWTSWTVPGWSEFNGPDYGAVAAYGDYVYVNDSETGNETPPDDGIIRFDMVHQTYERFAAGIDYSLVALGLDGVLYAVRADSSRAIDKYHPLTMDYIGTVTPLSGAVGLAAAADGALYINGGVVIRTDPAGNQELLCQDYSVNGNVNVARD